MSRKVPSILQRSSGGRDESSPLRDKDRRLRGGNRQTSMTGLIGWRLQEDAGRCRSAGAPPPPPVHKWLFLVRGLPIRCSPARLLLRRRLKENSFDLPAAAAPLSPAPPPCPALLHQSTSSCLPSLSTASSLSSSCATNTLDPKASPNDKWAVGGGI